MTDLRGTVPTGYPAWSGFSTSRMATASGFHGVGIGREQVLIPRQIRFRYRVNTPVNPGPASLPRHARSGTSDSCEGLQPQQAPLRDTVKTKEIVISDGCFPLERREALFLAAASAAWLPFELGTSQLEASASAGPQPVANLPMTRLKLPPEAVGRDYLLVQLTISGQGPFDFMVDSGLTAELITPHLQQSLSIKEDSKQEITGLGAGGKAAPGKLVELVNASLCCGDFPLTGAAELPLPPLHALVTDFPQEHFDPDHDPVEGMLGMELLSLYDTDLDFQNNRIRLWEPGTFAQIAQDSGLVEVPAAVLNETGLLGIRLTSADQPQGTQPMVGIIDCGAAFSAVNWAGAQLLGLPAKGDTAAYKASPTLYGVGVDGKPLPLFQKSVRLTFAGDAYRDSQGTGKFADPPPGWQPWEAVDIAIGDLPAFSQLLGDGRRPFQGPAVLLGLDVLSQRRVVLEAASPSGKASRRRRLFISAS